MASWEIPELWLEVCRMGHHRTKLVEFPAGPVWLLSIVFFITWWGLDHLTWGYDVEIMGYHWHKSNESLLGDLIYLFLLEVGWSSRQWRTYVSGGDATIRWLSGVKSSPTCFFSQWVPHQLTPIFCWKTGSFLVEIPMKQWRSQVSSEDMQQGPRFQGRTVRGHSRAPFHWSQGDLRMENDGTGGNSRGNHPRDPARTLTQCWVSFVLARMAQPVFSGSARVKEFEGQQMGSSF